MHLEFYSFVLINDRIIFLCFAELYDINAEVELETIPKQCQLAADVLQQTQVRPFTGGPFCYQTLVLFLLLS